MLAGAAAVSHSIPPAIQRALAVNAREGSTYLDAEHVVFLMQENRSFDHCYGTLRGVRGFNDPRAITQPDGLPIWVQHNEKGAYYAPFRLDITNTKSTWMGSLPHGWRDMVHARNNGKLDTWLEAKKAGNPEYAHMPLTMGYYDRADIPFYYAFADAFTVCDQHFCSSLTGTSANRSYFWAGTVREQPHHPDSVAHVDNGQINYKDVGWKTYPERLQEEGISWRVYQNELSIPVGLAGEAEDWLANFTNNNLEFHKQYSVRFHPAHRAHLATRVEQLAGELRDSSLDAATAKDKHERLARLREDLRTYSAANFEALSEHDREIHRRAFATNTGDPDYHQLETIRYTDEDGEKEVQVPKGDIFHQFRQDVEAGELPTVSWLCAPCNFSDHPGAPWYGAWYVSEALDILTRNPEIWKKTIFILTYDENDGYFDHVPPFTPPLTGRHEAGSVAAGINTADEYVTAAQERMRTGHAEATLDSPIGLGFRVPMVVASPWTKGGWVNSEVFDHTSCLQFLEHFIEKKTGKTVVESNISPWRRLICGNLTSVFRPAVAADAPPIQSVGRDAYVERIYSAKSKGLPGNYRLLEPSDLDQIRRDPAGAPQLARQEPGTKPACATPYLLSADAVLNEGNEVVLTLHAGGGLPKTKTIGVPFQIRAVAPFGEDMQRGRVWEFAVREEESLTYTWPLREFAGGRYHLTVHGPNGFFREFKGGADDPVVHLRVTPAGNGLVVSASGRGNTFDVRLSDMSYGLPSQTVQLGGRQQRAAIDVSGSNGWYDVKITVRDFPTFMHRFAGHVEDGKPSITDPLMGLVSPGAAGST